MPENRLYTRLELEVHRAAVQAMTRRKQRRYLQCPWCLDLFEENCEYVDVGVGEQQVSGNQCDNCGAGEVGMSISEKELEEAYRTGMIRGGYLLYDNYRPAGVRIYTTEEYMELVHLHAESMNAAVRESIEKGEFPL